MAQEKDCETCSKTYSRNVNYSDKQWSLSRFCSRRCAANKPTEPTELERLFSFVKIDEHSKCWLWNGAMDAGGYGFFNSKRVHRHVYQAAVGDIPKGMLVLHRCDNRSCCNPLHLFIGTYQDNADDMSLKGRDPYGDRAGKGRLTEKEVIEIRADPRTQEEISAAYGVAQTTVSAIKLRKNWKHI